MKKVAVSEYKNKIMLSVFDDDVLSELSFYDNDKIPLESVFLCRVSNTLPNIDACFIQYQKGKTGFLKSKKYTQEEIIPLQLKKESSGNKEPVFTDEISLSSKYCVVSDGKTGVNVSSKIDESIAADLRKQYRKVANDLHINVILRTNAATATPEEILSDIITMADKLKEIRMKASSRTLYSVLYMPQPEYLRAIRDINTNELSEIVTDIPEISNELKASLEPKYDKLIRLYKDDLLPLNKLLGMDSKIKEALARVVYLKSGAQIVIDRTEALIAIDVNTYHTNKECNKEDTFFNTNIEAATEIMRQIKLRNLSGMILIDFINMKLDKHYEELIEHITNLAKKDTAKISVIDVTGLKLVELVRSKKHLSVYEQLR